MNILKKKSVYGLLATLPLVVLAGCADDRSDSDPKDTESEYGELQSAYPGARIKMGAADSMAATMIVGQEENIPTTAAAVFHFDRSVKGLDPLNYIRFTTVGDGNWEDEPIDFHVEYRHGGKTVVVIPDAELEPLQRYKVYLPLKRDPEILPEYQDTHFGRYYTAFFDTTPRWEGTPEETSLETGYFRNVARNLIPFKTHYNTAIGSAEFPVFPNSSLTVELNQPVDPSTVQYGPEGSGNIRLVDCATGDSQDPVDCQAGHPLDGDVDVTISGRYITLDPVGELDVAGIYNIEFAEEGDPDAIRSLATGQPLQRSAAGGLLFGVTGEPGVDYEILADWPTSMTIRPEISASDFTVARTNAIVTGSGEVLALADEDLEVEMTSIPEEIGFSDRTFFSIKKSDRSPGERRLAILSDSYGYVDWRTHDRFAGSWDYDKVVFFADIGILDEGGNVETSARARFHGEATGDPREGEAVIIDVVSGVDPEAFEQDRLPGNGLINLKFRMVE